MKILAIDIGGTAIKYGLVNGDYQIEQAFEVPTEAQLGGPHLMHKIMNLVGEFADEADCVGISTAGQVNSELGKIIFASENIPNYTGIEITQTIRKKYNLPVRVENDVNSAATAEAVFGAARGYRDFLCLTYGTGVGGALWINNQIYTGHHFSAGEFGHIVTHTGGKKCTCGNNGCYEMYASTRALVYAVKEATGKTLTGREIFTPEHFNNVTVRAVIDNWIDEIIGGLTTLIFIFNPPCIILGGGIMNEDYIISEIDRRIHARPMHSFRSVEIKKAAMKNQAGMLGAAYLAKKALEEV